MIPRDAAGASRIPTTREPTGSSIPRIASGSHTLGRPRPLAGSQSRTSFDGFRPRPRYATPIRGCHGGGLPFHLIIYSSVRSKRPSTLRIHLFFLDPALGTTAGFSSEGLSLRVRGTPLDCGPGFGITRRLPLIGPCRVRLHGVRGLPPEARAGGIGCPTKAQPADYCENRQPDCGQRGRVWPSFVAACRVAWPRGGYCRYLEWARAWPCSCVAKGCRRTHAHAACLSCADTPTRAWAWHPTALQRGATNSSPPPKMATPIAAFARRRTPNRWPIFRRMPISLQPVRVGKACIRRVRPSPTWLIAMIRVYRRRVISMMRCRAIGIFV